MPYSWYKMNVIYGNIKDGAIIQPGWVGNVHWDGKSEYNLEGMNS